jgi:hypothetical protein
MGADYLILSYLIGIADHGPNLYLGNSFYQSFPMMVGILTQH